MSLQSNPSKYIKLNLFTKLKTIMKRKNQDDDFIKREWYQMIADNSRIEARKHYQQRKRLYYIATVNSVYMRNQYFIQNLPEQDEQFNQQQDQVNQNEDSKMIETTQNLDKIKKIVKVRLPTDFVLVVWNIYIMFLIFSQMLIIPLVLSFDLNYLGFDVYDWIINGCFYVDILLQFNTAIYVDGNLQSDRKIIIREYLKLWFWIDLLSSFPYDAIFDSPSLQSKAQMMKLLRFMKFIKVVRLLRALKLKKIFGRIEEYISVIESLFQMTQMAKLLIQVLCIAHWCACIWNLFVDGSTDNWAAKYKIQDDDWTVKYLTAFYYSMANIITVGYGDIHAHTIQEMIYAIFLMLLSSAVIGYTTNIVMELFTNQYDKFLEQEQNLKNYLRKKKVDVSLTSRVTNYLDWLQISFAKAQQHESTVIDSLSANLKSEVICLINSKIIEKISFFQSFSKDLLSNIAYQLQEKVFGPEEIIFEQNTMGDEMYYIVNGSIKVKYNQKVIATLIEDDIFGEVCLFSGKPRSATMLTEDYVNLLVLKRDSFLIIIQQLQSDLEKYHQLKYYLDIEEDYSVLGIKCYLCEEPHLAIHCPMAHLQVDKIKFIQAGYHLKYNFLRGRKKGKHAILYPKDQNHQKGLKKLHQKLMKLHLLGRPFVVIKHNAQGEENNFLDAKSFDIDQVKIYENYVTKGNIDEITLSLNLNAEMKLRQMLSEKEKKFEQKKSQLSRVRKAIILNPFLGMMKPKQESHQNQQFLHIFQPAQNQVPQIQASPLQTKRNRMKQVRNLRQASQSQLMKAQLRQENQTQSSQYKVIEEHEQIEKEESIQKLKYIRVQQFQKFQKKLRRASSLNQRKGKKLTRHEMNIVSLIKQVGSAKFILSP